ncbi:hypothetical protein BDP27DRAFT_1404841 [Rhodocollybia butyracea]|uniref:Uncharacterized protein n=1 Tax=Rhodocollybia butyracea TaxID=206335 RepID=A0A9P5U4B4_9AGAR|nr:hypothetical protein BDP27DRAFT_1404841 [Rhodocollybia butyracea]
MAVAKEGTWTCNVIPNCPYEKFSISLVLHKSEYHTPSRSIKYAGETVQIRRGPDGKLECPCGEPKHARYNYQKISNMCSLRTGHPPADATKWNDWTEYTYSHRSKRIRTKSITPASSAAASANSDSTNTSTPTSKRRSNEQPSCSRNIRPKLENDNNIASSAGGHGSTNKLNTLQYKLTMLKRESDKLDKELENKKKEEAEIRALESQIEDMEAEINAKRQKIDAYRFGE